MTNLLLVNMVGRFRFWKPGSVSKDWLLGELGLLMALRFLEGLFAGVESLAGNLSTRPGCWVVDSPWGWGSNKPGSGRSDIVSSEQVGHKKGF